MRAGLVGASKSRNRASCSPDAGDVRLDLLGRQQQALLRLAARIADHAGAAADDRDRRVAEALQPRQPHHREQRADVQARRRRIEADVGGDAFGREQRRAALRSRRRPCRATAARRTDCRRIRHRGNRVTIPVDGRHSTRGPQDAARHGRRRGRGNGCVRVSCTAGTSSTSRSENVPIAGLPPGARRAAHRPDHRRPSQPARRPRRRRARRRPAHERASRSHRPRRRLRHLGRSAVRGAVGGGARRRSRRRTASSPSSATTTTITTCRSRSPGTASRS